MRWTIPTLIQVLVDQGVSPDTATRLVERTYPTTEGDTFYRSSFAPKGLGHGVGVYGLWNDLRADQSPLGGVKVTDDARRIAQALRGGETDLGLIVDTTDPEDATVSAIAWRTFYAIRDGAHFDPQQVEPDDNTASRLAELSQTLRRLDGLPEYIASIPLPRFN